jgi:hypothetical protein
MNELGIENTFNLTEGFLAWWDPCTLKKSSLKSDWYLKKTQLNIKKKKMNAIPEEFDYIH